MGKSCTPKTAGAEGVYKQKVGISLLKILFFFHEFMGLKVDHFLVDLGVGLQSWDIPEISRASVGGF